MRQRRRPRLSRLRTAEIEGIAPDTRPVMTLVIIAASLLVTLVLATDELDIDQVGGMFVGLDDEPWRYVTTPFVHDSLGYQFVALTAVGIFGSLLERRFGWFRVLFVFLAAGAAGAAAAVAVDLTPLFDDFPIYAVLGANGAALGLLCRLVRGRPPRGEPRRRPRERPARRLRVRRGPARCSRWRSRRPAWWRASRVRPSARVLGLMLPLFTRR